MNHDIRGVFWWDVLKKDITEFLAKCPNCQQVKVKHQKRGSLLQEIQVSTWKWEDINMDFIVGLPGNRRQNESIRVVGDRLTKSAHFIPIKSTYSVKDYANIYIDEHLPLVDFSYNNSYHSSIS